MAMLNVTGISYTYPDGRPALDSVDFQASAGENIAVMGPNGSGKSTLFLCLGGVLSPSCGQISLDGVAVGRKNLDMLRRKVGLVFQDPDDQLFAPTVWSDVAFGPRNLGLTDGEISARVNDALSTMGIEELSGRPPDTLSVGQKKKVAIAGILAMGTEIVVLDEPTAGLDPQGCDDLLAAIEELRSEGKTIIVSTHDVELAARWADRVYMLNHGKVAVTGDPRKIMYDEALMKRCGLRVPMIMQAYRELKDRGLTYGGVPLSIVELAASLSKIRQTCAIAEADFCKGDKAGLIMRKGVLYAVREEGVPTCGYASADAVKGQDLTIHGVTESLITNTGWIACIRVPTARKNTVDIIDETVSRAIRKLEPDRVGILGTPARATAARAGIAIDIEFEVTLSAIQAASKGLNVAVLASGRMADALREKVEKFNAMAGTDIQYSEHIEGGIEP